jgi:Ras-related protein Rab-8A
VIIISPLHIFPLSVELTKIIEYLSEQGLDFKTKTIEVDEKKIKIQIWDTTGQERYQAYNRSYYKGAMGIILCYSVDDKNSFLNFENWVNQIKEHASEGVCKILIGNKCDTPDRVISYEEGKRLADALGMQFFETSAKENLNVEEAVRCIAKEVKDKLGKKGGASPSGMRNGAITGGNEGQKLSVIPKTETKKSGCC